MHKSQSRHFFFKALGIISLLLAITAGAVFLAWPDQNTHIIFCDVGQGDGILITHGFFQILIDSGPDPKVLECLHTYMPFWDRQLEVVVSTHPDADHIGGFAAVLKEYRPLEFWIEGRSHNSSMFGKLRQRLEELQAKGTKIVIPKVGDILRIDTERYGKVIFPQERIGELEFFTSTKTETQLSAVATAQTKKYGPTNEQCIALFFTFSKIHLLLTGDLEKSAELALVQASVLEKAEILKAGHHGSKTSSTLAFLDKVRPEVVVISLGLKNRYGHPHQEVLTNFSKIGARVLRTDQLGTVEIITDGQKYWISSKKQTIH